MSFVVLIPARMSSTRLPGKPLADIGGKPMVVRVAEQARRSSASQVVVAADHPDILQACADHGVSALLTSADHLSGSDRLAQACAMLGLDDTQRVVNVQGDEPLIEPELINAVAHMLLSHPQASMSTAAHPITDAQDFANPNVVKVVCDQQQRALYFSRAPIPHARDATAGSAWWQQADAPGQAWRHIGIYGYRAGFLKSFPNLTPAPLERLESLEQLRALWHGHSIVVHPSLHAPAAGVDTPEDLARVRKAWSSGL